MLSPSSSEVKWPRSWSRCSRVHATVDLPLPLRPAPGEQQQQRTVGEAKVTAAAGGGAGRQLAVL